MHALLLALALGAPAHGQSEGKSSFKLDDTGHVAIGIQLGETDLPELCNVDFSVAERAREEAELSRCLEQGLPRWLRLSGDGRPCRVAFLRWTPRGRTVVVDAEALCATPPRQLTIDWGLFVGSSLDHVSVAVVEEPHGKPHAVLLSKRSPRFVLEVRRPWWPFALAGALVLALVAALVAWARARRRLRAAGPAPG